MAQTFDVQSALKAGASYSDVARYLSETRGFDYDGAVKAGASDEDVVAYLEGRGLEEQPDRTILGTVQDVAATGAKGIIGAADALVGVADIPTLGQAGRSAQLVGLQQVYDDPRDAERALAESETDISSGKRNEFVDKSPYSEAQQYAQRQVSNADGVFGKLEAAVRNPSTIATTAGGALPSMFIGGMAGRALSAGTKLSPIAGAAIGEGAIGAGSSAEQIRKESPEGVITPQQAAMAAASGVGTGIFGYIGGKIANKLGFEDADTLIANGFQRVAKQAGKEGAEKSFAQSAAEVAGRIVGGGISEGMFEELPQSVQEQMWQNAATGRPLTEGMDEAAVMGTLSGFAMGGGFNALPKPKPVEIPKGILGAATVDDAISSMEQDLSRADFNALTEAGQPAFAPMPEDNLQGEWNKQAEAAQQYNQARNIYGSPESRRSAMAVAPGMLAPEADHQRWINENSLERNQGMNAPVTPETSLLAQGEMTDAQREAGQSTETTPQSDATGVIQPDMEKVSATLAAIKAADGQTLEGMAQGMPKFLNENPEYKQFEPAFRQEFYGRRRELQGQTNEQQIVSAIVNKTPISAEANSGPVQRATEGVRADERTGQAGIVAEAGAVAAAPPAEVLPRNIGATRPAEITGDTERYLQDQKDRRSFYGVSDKSVTPSADTQGFIRDQQGRKGFAGSSNEYATPNADTGGFVRDQQLRREGMGTVKEPVRRQPGESTRDFLKRRKEENAKLASRHENMDSIELAREMSRVYDSRPKPISKMFGSSPTQAQVEEHKKLTREYNSKRSKLARLHKVALERDNALFRDKQIQANPQPATQPQTIQGATDAGRSGVGDGGRGVVRGGEADAGVEAKFKSKEHAEQIRQIANDQIATHKANGSQPPQHLINKVADAGEYLSTGNVSEGVAGEQVFGHPEATNIYPGKYGNLIPIRASNREGVESRIDRAQKLFDEIAQDTAKVRYAASNGDKKAKAEMKTSRFSEKETIMELLRNETMPALNRLLKAVEIVPITPTPQERGQKSGENGQVDGVLPAKGEYSREGLKEQYEAGKRYTERKIKDGRIDDVEMMIDIHVRGFSTVQDKWIDGAEDAISGHYEKIPEKVLSLTTNQYPLSLLRVSK